MSSPAEILWGVSLTYKGLLSIMVSKLLDKIVDSETVQHLHGGAVICVLVIAVGSICSYFNIHPATVLLIFVSLCSALATEATMTEENNYASHCGHTQPHRDIEKSTVVLMIAPVVTAFLIQVSTWLGVLPGWLKWS